MILVRYGEIALKGDNRIVFERKLVENIRKCLEQNNIKADVRRATGRVLVDAERNAIDYLQNVFGIVSLSKAVVVDVDFEKIKEKAVEMIKEKNAKTFRISARRIQKSLIPSQDMNVQIGAYVVEKLGLKVKLENPDVDLQIEVADKAYVFTEVVQAVGGLPYGIEGTVLALIEDKQGLQAAFLAMKRGCDIVPVAFKQQDITILQKYSPKKLELKVLKKDELADFAKQANAKAIVTGETLNNLKWEFNFPILRPLIGIEDENAHKL